MSKATGRLVKLAHALYTRAPQDWISGAANRARALQARLGPHRPMGATLSPEYLAARNARIAESIGRVESGEPVAAVVSGFNALAYDERVLEYSLVSEWLLQRPTDSDLLDVGCVMNNPLMTPLLESRVRNVWLSNVALEQVSIRNPVFYHLERLDLAFPRGPKFSAITCLSTIEHIGYDNRHYGVDLPALYTEPTREPLIQSLSHLTDLLAPEGHLLVTVPFGVPELVLHPRTGRAAMQVFGVEALNAATEIIRNKQVDVSAEVWEATKDGWGLASASDCSRHYALGGPAATAVAVIRARRM